MQKVSLGNKIKDGNLFADSSDFSVSGKSSASRESEDLSFKNNGPAQRYMIIYDGKGQVRKIFGGYSPKIYDSTALKL